MIIKRRSFLASLPLAGAAVTVVSCGGGGGGRGLVPSVAPVSLAAVPSSFAWPDATNTGSSGSLTAYTGPMTITADGTTIDSQEITGDLVVKANNVRVTNCHITGWTYYGIVADGQSGLYVGHCTITGPGLSGDGNTCVNTGTDAHVEYCNLSEARNGVAPDNNTTINNNYIHDLNSNEADPHMQDIIFLGGNAVTIQDNTLVGRSTANVFCSGQGGPITNVTVNHNKMINDPAAAPGYALYFEDKAYTCTGCAATDNIVQRGGYGYFFITGSQRVSGNTDYITGKAIPY